MFKCYPGRQFLTARINQQSLAILDFSQIFSTYNGGIASFRYSIGLPVMVWVTMGNQNMSDTFPF